MVCVRVGVCACGEEEEGAGCCVIDHMLLIVHVGCVRQQVCQRGRWRIDGRAAAGDECESRSLFIALWKPEQVHFNTQLVFVMLSQIGFGRTRKWRFERSQEWLKWSAKTWRVWKTLNAKPLVLTHHLILRNVRF